MNKPGNAGLLIWGIFAMNRRNRIRAGLLAPASKLAAQI
jgi:hypothetical protein